MWRPTAVSHRHVECEGRLVECSQHHSALRYRLHCQYLAGRQSPQPLLAEATRVSRPPMPRFDHAQSGRGWSTRVAGQASKRPRTNWPGTWFMARAFHHGPCSRTLTDTQTHAHIILPPPLSKPHLTRGCLSVCLSILLAVSVSVCPCESYPSSDYTTTPLYSSIF